MYKFVFLILSSLISFCTVLGQYDIGIETSSKDIKIHGKIYTVVDTNSIIIGKNAGINTIDSLAEKNLFIGTEAGQFNTSGSENIFIGTNTGSGDISLGMGSRNIAIGNESARRISTGLDNTFFGHSSATNLTTASKNTFIGHKTGFAIGFDSTFISSNTFIGYNAGSAIEQGSNNVFIGSNAGRLLLSVNKNISNNIFIGSGAGAQAEESNRLYIENSESNTPLIYGEFDNDKIQINGSLHISEFTKLEPRSEAPLLPEKGTIYYDSDDDKVKVWTGSIWENLN